MANSAMMKTVLYGLKGYYQQADEVEKIILNCSIVAAGAAGAGGLFPVLSIPATIISCFGAVWTMYALICEKLEIRLEKNILKLLARAALSNIAANLASLFAAELVFAFIPGASVAASAVITFCTIYLAGMIFLKMVLSLAQQGRVGGDLGNLSSEEFAKAIRDQQVGKDDLKAAKSAYKESEA